MKKLLKIAIPFVKKEALLVIFTLLLIGLAIITPSEIPHYIRFIDWHTILMLTGLIVITTGVAESKFLRRITKRFVSKTSSERMLALKLVTLTLILSAFLTNDISLFIVVPLTLTLQTLIKNDIGKLIIFEAIAANTGSALTPIGNPQNIYLFRLMKVSFPKFVQTMIPMEVILIVILLLFVLIIFSGSKQIIPFADNSFNKNTKKENKFLFYTSTVFLFAYILTINANKIFLLYFTVIIVILYLVLFTRVIVKTDWGLIVLFCIMFIDFGIIAKFPQIYRLVQLSHIESIKNLFLLSVGSSQIMSNVPASIFITHFSKNYRIIAYGVNIGGNGFIVGSLANIIALRLSKKKIFLLFHKYSIPFLLITAGIMLAILSIFSF